MQKGGPLAPEVDIDVLLLDAGRKVLSGRSVAAIPNPKGASFVASCLLFLHRQHRHLTADPKVVVGSGLIGHNSPCSNQLSTCSFRQKGMPGQSSPYML